MSTTITRLAPLFISVAVLAACGDDTGGAGGSGSGGGATTSSTSSTSGATTGTTTTTTGSGGSGSGGAAAEGFSIAFRGDVGGTPFDCATQYEVGATAATASLTDFRFYVHDVRLIDAEGAEVPLGLTQDGLWQYENLALLDFEDRTGACANGTEETRTVVEGSAPAGDYVGLAFKVGVPAAMNHLDNAAAPSPLNLSGLFWAWTSGYKYMRVDAVADGAAGPFNLHLGAAGCSGDPALGETATCTNPNVVEVVLDGFDPASSVAVFDYADAVADADLTLDGGGAPGCMSGGADPECALVFPQLGLDLATGTPTGTPPAFHAE